MVHRDGDPGIGGEAQERRPTRKLLTRNRCQRRKPCRAHEPVPVRRQRRDPLLLVPRRVPVPHRCSIGAPRKAGPEGLRSRRDCADGSYLADQKRPGARWQGAKPCQGAILNPCRVVVEGGLGGAGVAVDDTSPATCSNPRSVPKARADVGIAGEEPVRIARRLEELGESLAVLGTKLPAAMLDEGPPGEEGLGGGQVSRSDTVMSPEGHSLPGQAVGRRRGARRTPVSPSRSARKSVHDIDHDQPGRGLLEGQNGWSCRGSSASPKACQRAAGPAPEARSRTRTNPFCRPTGSERVRPPRRHQLGVQEKRCTSRPSSLSRVSAKRCPAPGESGGMNLPTKTSPPSPAARNPPAKVHSARGRSPWPPPRRSGRARGQRQPPLPLAQL